MPLRRSCSADAGLDKDVFMLEPCMAPVGVSCIDMVVFLDIDVSGMVVSVPVMSVQVVTSFFCDAPL